MEKYIVTKETNWYTTSGQVGNSVNKKLQPGYTFDSLKESGGRRNVANTNMWIPAENCKLNTTPPPVDPPPVDPPPVFENFSPPAELMARWEIGKDSIGNPIYTEYYYYDVRPA